MKKYDRNMFKENYTNEKLSNKTVLFCRIINIAIIVIIFTLYFYIVKTPSTTVTILESQNMGVEQK